MSESPSRLRESLSDQQGQHIDVSTLYSDRYAELSELRDPSCPKCGKALEQFLQTEILQPTCASVHEVIEQITAYSGPGILVFAARVN